MRMHHSLNSLQTADVEKREETRQSVVAPGIGRQTCTPGEGFSSLNVHSYLSALLALEALHLFGAVFRKRHSTFSFPERDKW